jgi:hypothetical protein
MFLMNKKMKIIRKNEKEKKNQENEISFEKIRQIC